SARFREPEGRARAAEALRSGGVEGLVVIGGNGSLTGAHALVREHGIPVVGIPASIDNDIGCTALAIGTDTALNTIVHACDNIDDTARAHNRAFVVEVMGRACGYLAMASSVAAGADAVLFREQKRDEDTIVRAVAEVIQRGFARGKRRVLGVKGGGVGVPWTPRVRRGGGRLGGPGGRGGVRGGLGRGGRPALLGRRGSRLRRR